MWIPVTCTSVHLYSVLCTLYMCMCVCACSRTVQAGPRPPVEPAPARAARGCRSLLRLPPCQPGTRKAALTAAAVSCDRWACTHVHRVIGWLSTAGASRVQTVLSSLSCRCCAGEGTAAVLVPALLALLLRELLPASTLCTLLGTLIVFVFATGEAN